MASVSSSSPMTAAREAKTSVANLSRRRERRWVRGDGRWRARRGNGRGIDLGICLAFVAGFAKQRAFDSTAKGGRAVRARLQAASRLAFDLV